MKRPSRAEVKAKFEAVRGEQDPFMRGWLLHELFDLWMRERGDDFEHWRALADEPNTPKEQ